MTHQAQALPQRSGYQHFRQGSKLRKIYFYSPACLETTSQYMEGMTGSTAVAYGAQAKMASCKHFDNNLAAFCSKYLWQQQVRAATKMTNSLKSTWESLFSSRFLKTLLIASLSFLVCERKGAGQNCRVLLPASQHQAREA